MASRDVEDVKNIHPIYLIQLHPMWDKALEQCSMEDYHDFEHMGDHITEEPGVRYVKGHPQICIVL